MRTMEMLETERLILRRWEESDAENLYHYAKDPDVGPIAGWPPHQSVEESLDVIRNVFNGPEAYAICLKTDNKAIGAIELKLNGHTDMTECDDEYELGYWLGKPFWGRVLCRRQPGRCSGMPSKILACKRSGAVIMMAISSQSECRKNAASVTSGSPRASMYRSCMRNGQVMSI